MQVSNLSEDDVVISGLAIHLPGIDTYEKFTTNLMEGLPLRPAEVEHIPSGFHGEFPAPGGRIPKSNQLDTVFFGMNTSVFLGTDRVQMKGLETCFEALMDSGINAEEVKDFASEVFMNAARTDGEFVDLKDCSTRYHILGYCRALGPNRVSFHFDNKGQSVGLDCGLSGGMRGLEGAWKNIKENRSDLAIVGSGNLFIGELTTAQLNDLGLLSKDGRTCSFDNDADGFQRTEAYVSLILQKAKHAKRIYAKLNHVCCEFVSNQLTSPNVPSKECWIDFLNKVYSDCGISKERIQYLEANGAAIKEWDSAELNAAMELFCQNRQSPLMVGSVKSNIGHAEGAADLVSIIKAIICLENNKVPGNRCFKTPNRAVPGLIAGHLKVVDKTVPLPEDALVAVNTYTYGNVYGHCILEGFKKTKKNVAEDLPHLVLLSSRMGDFFTKIFHQVEDVVPFDTEYINLLHELFKDNVGQHLARGFTILPKRETSISQHQTIDGEKRPIWFIFSGMGSQWPGMGRDLMKLPIARQAIEKCHTILLPKGLDLIQILTSQDKDAFKDNLNSFVGIAAVQIALMDVLTALKIVPDGIIGHSLGEVGCAYADGSLDLEQTILASYYRGKAVKDAALQKGAMAAIGKGYSQLKDDLPVNVEVACHNSSTSSTISGLEQPVLQYVEVLQKRGVFAKVVEVGEIGFHSQFIAPAGPSLLKYMQNVIKEPKLRSNIWISSSVPEAKWSEEGALYSSAEYFTNNLLSSVLFEETCVHIPENALLLEIAPHGLLQAIMKRAFPGGVNIPLTSRTAPDNLVFLLQAIGKIYMAGALPDVAALYPAPKFPVGTKTNSLHRLFPWCTIARQDVIFSNTKRLVNLPKLIRRFDETLGEHNFRGKSVTPVSYYPYIAWHSFYQSDPSNAKKSFLIKDLKIFKPFDLSIGRDLTVEALTLLESDLTEITKEELLIASATTSRMEEKVTALSSRHFETKGSLCLNRTEIYNILARQGYRIAKNLQYLTSVNWSDNGIRATMTFKTDWVPKVEALLHLAYLNITRKEEKLVTIRKIGQIEVAAIKLHEEPLSAKQKDIELFYDCATNELSTSGLYMKDVTYKAHSGDSSSLQLQSILPYAQPPLKSIEEYVYFCGQIMSSLTGIEVTAETKILEVQHKHLSPLAPVIEAMFPSVKANVLPIGGKHDRRTQYDLAICASSEIQDYIQEISSYAIVRSLKDSIEFESPEGFSIVSAYIPIKGESIFLLKKKVILNGEAQFITIPKKEGELIATLKKRQKFRTNALLVGFTEPSEGALRFIDRIQSKTSMVLKWMFILDAAAPKFCIEDPFYKNQLEKGLSLNVLLNGTWNFIYKKQLQPSVKEIAEKSTANEANLDNVPSGSELSMMLPPDWNVENKEALAAAYVMAYYCIVAAADSRPYDGVLVTDGGSVIGQAAIAVALTRTNRVYATVATHEEAAKLQSTFPLLNAANIILHSDPNFIVKLKDATLENFPNIIYNQLDGRIAQDIFAFPPPFAHIFHLGKKDIEANHTLFTSQFLQYVSLIAMSMENIVNWHMEDKKEVWELVRRGIECGVVRPLQTIQNAPPSLSGRSQKVQRLASKCFRENEFEIKIDGVYFVIGETTDIDLDVAEWLIRRGAKNIFLYNASQRNRNDYPRKLGILRLQRTATIHMLDDHTVRKLLADVKNRTVQLEAVFYIHLIDQEPSPEVVEMTDALSTELNHFVSISRSRQFALKMQKYSNPRPCTSIVWRTEQELIARNMDVLTSLIGEHSFASIDGTARKLHTGGKISEIIPCTLESIRLLGAGLSSELQLIELSTSGLLKNSCSAECQPVFLFPGVEEDVTETAKVLARGLHTPTFAVKVPSSEKFKVLSTSAATVTEILKVADRKIYNLVGLSTGCILAMEVARQLEQKGKVVSLILVDDPLHLLGDDNVKMAINETIFDTLAAIIPPEAQKVAMDNLSWDLQLSHLVSAIGLKPLTESFIIKGIKHISSFLSTICNYDATDLKLKGPLTILRSDSYIESDIAYNEICSSNHIMDMAMSHKLLMRSEKLQGIINKAVILDDVSPKTAHELLWVAFESVLDKLRTADEGSEIKALW